MVNPLNDENQKKTEKSLDLHSYPSIVTFSTWQHPQVRAHKNTSYTWVACSRGNPTQVTCNLTVIIAKGLKILSLTEATPLEATKGKRLFKHLSHFTSLMGIRLMFKKQHIKYING